MVLSIKSTLKEQAAWSDSTAGRKPALHTADRVQLLAPQKVLEPHQD